MNIKLLILHSFYSSLDAINATCHNYGLFCRLKTETMQIVDKVIMDYTKNMNTDNDLTLTVSVWDMSSDDPYDFPPEDTSIHRHELKSIGVLEIVSKLWITDSYGNGHLQLQISHSTGFLVDDQTIPDGKEWFKVLKEEVEKGTLSDVTIVDSLTTIEEAVEPTPKKPKQRGTVTAIVCADQQGGIGYKGDIPWKIRGDLEHFQQQTRGKQCIVGATTFEGLDKSPMKEHDRSFWVLGSRYEEYAVRTSRLNAVFFTSMDKLVEALKNRSPNYEDVMVIGGGTIYEYFLTHGLLTHVWLSSVDATYRCDVTLPSFTPEGMAAIGAEEVSDSPVFKQSGDTDSLIDYRAVLYKLN